MNGKNGTGKILEYFKEISRIPRCSGNERAVSDYLMDFAKEHGIEAIQDDCLNVVMKKPATEGYENAPVVMLQGHMDMVCVKAEETEHDFENDPLEILEDGGFIKAAGTSLGADNGIAVAYIMALMESGDLKHPALEGVITTSEETGMDGVIGLDTSRMEAKILMNLDSEEEGVFLASSAGGINNVVRLPLKWEETPRDASSFEIRIKGLKGGHSGSEIDKRRGNAIKLIGRLMDELDAAMFRISRIKGGSKRNAIAEHCGIKIVCSKGDAEVLKTTVKRTENLFRDEFGSAEPELEITLKEIQPDAQMCGEGSVERLRTLLMLMPCGVQTMSESIPGLVESSLNLGTIEMDGGSVVLTNSIRSSVATLKDEINGRIAKLCMLLGADSELDSDYPGWAYSEESFIRDVMTAVYEEISGKKASVEAIHAGLECGFLKAKMPGLDIISLGPDMFDVHSPRERLDIASAERTWELIVASLERIN